MTASPERSRIPHVAPKEGRDAGGDRERVAALELEIERLRAELREAGEVRSRFLATVSHELRTPLQVVTGYADLLQAGIPVTVPEPAREHAHHIGRAAQHLVGLVDQLLSFSRIESGREGLHLEHSDLVTLTRQAAALVQPLVRRKGLQLDLNLPDLPELVVETDVVKVRQVIYNLLTNAVKFTDRGEVSLTLHAPRDGMVRIAVGDTGCGMTEAELAQAFETFWQAERLVGTGVAPRGGTGLGLSISRELARMLGGDVSACSEAGRGSVFTFTIPAATAPGTLEEPAIP